MAIDPPISRIRPAWAMRVLIAAWMLWGIHLVASEAETGWMDDLDPPVGLPVVWRHQPAVSVLDEQGVMDRIYGELLGEAGREPEDRAALLLQRARARQCLWLLDAALADIDAAAQLAPRSALILLERARLLGAMERADEASVPLQLAFRSDPESLETAAVLGLLRFEQGRFSDAAAALGFRLEGADPADPLRWLYATAMLRSGRVGALSWDGWLRPRDPWPGPLDGFISGRIGRDTFFALVRAMDPDPEVACLSWFYAGERALEEGNRDRAVRDFFGVLRSGYTEAVEYRLAVAELRRLGALEKES